MNRFTKFTTAALVAVLAFTACDEGTPPPVEPPDPPTPVGTISGTVTIEGTAASGVTATLSSGATTTTGSGGSFAFSGVEAGAYTVTISGFPEDATFAQVTQSATIATDGENVQLNFAGEYIRSSAVVGNVVAADAMMSGGDGQPETLIGVTVTLGGEHAMGETMTTDETGGFAFTGLRAGTYSVTISDFPEDVSFETVSIEVEVDVGDVGQADFTGHFIRTSAVEGQVIIEGEGLAGVTVTLSGGPADESYTSMTDAEGLYRFEELRPGDYTVEITDFDPRDYEFAATSQDVSVDLDETGTVSFTGVLLRTSGISGRVSVEGMGLGDVTVTLSGAADNTTMTDASGQYGFAGLAAGDYMVSIAVESDAYVFDETSKARTLDDDQSMIVNFEGAHARTASVSGMLFVDEAMKNDTYDEGEDAFPGAAMLEALQAAGVQLPPMLPVPITLVGPSVNEMRSGTLNLATGQFSFGELVAGDYELRVGSLASLLPALPPAAAAVLRDFEYGGPAAGYELEVGVGEDETQNIPVDITHTTAHFVVTLKSGDARGMPVPGATVSLSSGGSDVGSGMTGDKGLAMIRFARAGTTGNTVNASVAVDGYEVDDGMTAVAWDPKSPHTQATNSNDIVNLNVNVSVSGATITTDYGGGDALGGWAISVMSGEDAVEGAPEALDADGNASFMTTVAKADLPVSYSFSVADDQDDNLDGGESYVGTSVDYMHNGLSLARAMDAGSVEVRYTTQTLKVYAHHERDQVEGYTGNVLGGDVRDDGKVSVSIRYIDDSGRSRAFASADKVKSGSAMGVTTFSNVPADRHVIAQAEVAAGYKLLDPDELAAYTAMEDNGVTGGAFGAMGGFSHTVELCPLQATNPQDHDECASFAYVSTHSVSGLVWKRGVKKSGDDFMEEDPAFVAGQTVGLDPVEGKNLAGDAESYTTAANDNDETPLDETHQFSFTGVAAGVYKLNVPSGWRAKMGGKGATAAVGDAFNPLDGDVSLDVTPTTSTVYGRVNGADGFPLDAVTVTVNGRSDVTDAAGRYIVDGVSAVRGQVFVSASRAGHQAGKPDSTSVAFGANSVTRHDFDLSAVGQYASISGTVRASGTNAPVAGVEIRVDGVAPTNAATSGANSGKLVTGADGTYTAVIAAKAIGSTASVSASKAGMTFVPAAQPAPAHAGAEISGIDFTGFANATIFGRVVAPAGGPMSGVAISATPAGGGDAADADTTGVTGTFSLSVPYGSYNIAASSEGNYTFTYPNGVTTVNVAPGQSVNYGDIQAASRPPQDPPNDPPAFSSPAAFEAVENQRSVGTVVAADPNAGDGAPSYAISGGADAAMLDIDASTGELVFNASPDFEAPGDVDGGNDYEIVVEATSGTAHRMMSATQAITVTVTDVDERIPQVTLVLDPASVSENAGVSRITATVDPVSATAFDVTVSAAAVTPAVDGDFILSNNVTLSFAANAASSRGAVSITAVNNNDYEGDKTVRVSGSVSSTGVTAPADVDLTIAEDDEKPAPEATLSSLTLSGVDAADLNFDAATMTYAVSVEHEVDMTTVEATPSEGATAVITPADADAAMDGHQVALAVGDTEIGVVVTTEEGKRADYTVTVTRMALSDDVSLAKFTVNDGTADADVMADASGVFAHGVGYDVMQVTVSAMAGHADAQGAEITSPADADANTAGHQVDLAVGDNAIVATVTAEDGSTGEHTLTVTREQSSDVSLAKFTVNDGTADTDVNADANGVFAHGVGYDVMQVTVSATAGHASAQGAEITSPADADANTAGHQVDLAVGDNAIVATVTAQDGSTGEHTLTVTRTAAATDADLAKFVVTVGEDDPVDVVANADMEYEFTVPGAVEKVTVEAVPAGAPAATAVITRPADADDEMDGHQVDLASGANSIEATVTAQDGTEEMYELTVTRTEPGILVSMEQIALGEGNSATYMVGLATKPDDHVVVTIAAGTDLTVNRTSLTFAPENWQIMQEVEVTADETNSNFDNAVGLILGHTSQEGSASDDGGDYDIAEAVNVSVDVTNDDAEGAAVTVAPTALTVDEGGDSGEFTVTLGAVPLSDVTVTVEVPTDPDRTGDLTALPASLTFTTDNWDVGQIVTVTATDDDVDADKDDVVLALEASGGGYDDIVGEAADDVTVTITDDDVAAVEVIGLEGRQVREGGSLAYRVKLGSQPEGEVYIQVEATGVHFGRFTFDETNWSRAQALRISVPEDEDTDDETVALTFTVSGAYPTATAPTGVQFSVRDNDADAGGVIVSHTQLSIAAGGTGHYMLSLTQAPASGESLTVTVGSTGQVQIDPLTVTFDTSNWNAGERVDLSPLAQATGSITVTHTAAASTGGDDDDAKYRTAPTVDSVTVTIPE